MNEPDAKNVPPRMPMMPSRESVTHTQLNQLLGIINVTTNNLAVLRANPDTTDGTPARKVDGGVLMAAEVTLVKTLDRIDKILDDDSRWNFQTQNSMESALKDVYEQHARMIAAQATNYEMLLSPANRFRPALFRLKDLRYAAVLGDWANPEGMIWGVGDSPEHALMDFNLTFAGIVKHHPDTLKLAQFREAQLDRGSDAIPPVIDTTKPKRKQRKK